MSSTNGSPPAEAPAPAAAGPRHFWQGLYGRMALYIALALLAFVLLGIGSVVFVASAQLRDYIAARHGDLGQQAADVLTREGRAGLEHWLRTAPMPDDATVYILDSTGRDLLGRRLPADYDEFVRSYAVAPAEPLKTNYRPVSLAPQLVAPDGTSYAFLPLPRNIRIWGSPATALGLALAAMLVTGSVAWLIARTVGRPLGQLQQAVRELAGGRLDARAPEALARRSDELGTLAADFNSMAGQLSAAVAGRQQLMAELSHELRSPLARLQAAMALATLKQSLGDRERERMEQEIARLDRVIGDLLRLSRLGAAAPMARRLLRVEDLVESLRHDEEVEAASRRVELAVRSAVDLAVVGDPELLRSGLENILRNAIRYAPAGSTVEIVVGRAGRDVVVQVADRGPGVPWEHLARIFEPYYRVPRQPAGAPGSGPALPGGDGEEGGTGLGLAIARRVFELHGGSIAAANREGGGLVVTARLPAAEPG